MNNTIKVALIIAVSILIAVIYYSHNTDYKTCVRAQYEQIQKEYGGVRQAPDYVNRRCQHLIKK